MNQATTPQRSGTLLSTLDSLLGAVSAYRNLRALVLMGLSFIAAVIVGGLFGMLAGAMESFFIGALGSLLAAVTALYGVSAVGIMLMRDAQGQERCSIAEAVLQSLFSTHRLIAVAILEGLIVLVAVIVAAILLFICKIPALGPVLYTVVFPVLAVVLGMLVFALFYVMFPLAGPAVWTGSTVFQVVARLNMLARRRLIEIVGQQFVLFVIVSFVTGIIFAIVMIGVGMVSGMSASIVGFGGLGLGFDMGFDGRMGMSYGSGASYILAGSIGGGVLFAVAAVIPALISLKGCCLIYLNTTAGLDFAQAEADLEGGVAAVKAKAEQARERARQLAEQHARAQAEAAEKAKAKASADALAAAAAAEAASAEAAAAAVDAGIASDSAAAPAAAAGTPAAGAACPQCKAPVGPDDRFCGECGFKLQ